MASHIVLTDGFHWSQPGWNPLLREHRFAKRGETIELPDEVYQTLSRDQLAALGTEEDLAATVAAAEAGWQQLPDATIADMTVEQITAYLDSAPEALHDSETERVVDLEENGKQRKSVLALLASGEDDEDDGLPPEQ